MKKKIGFWMLLSFVLFSCAKEQEPEQIVRESGQAGPEAGYASLNAAIEADDDTRNSLEDADGKRYLLWSEGEIIGVTGNTSGNARASLETGFGGKASGTFWYNSEVVKGGVKYGYYPYTTDAYVSGTTLNVTLPDVQPYKEGSMIADNVLVMAGRMSGGKLVFTNACSIVKVQLTGTGRLLDVRLRSISKPLAGTGTVNLSASQPVFTVTGNEKYEIRLDLGDGLFLSETEPVSVYFVVPAGTYDDLILYAGNQYCVMQRNASSSHSFTVRHITPMVQMAVSVPKLSQSTSLSTGGTSNCYLIDPSAPAALYSFQLAKVRGTAITGVAAMDCLWETTPGLVRDICYNKSDNSFTFRTTTGISGNALLAAMDNTGKVLWSWHIWISETSDQLRDVGEYGQYTFMDRNLGATYMPKSKAEIYTMTDQDAVNSAGFQYQWGRKDPFPGASTFDSRGTYGKYEAGAVTSGLTNKDGFDIPSGLFGPYTYKVCFHKFYPDYQGWELRNMVKMPAEMAAWPLSFNKLFYNQSHNYAMGWASNLWATASSANWAVRKTDNDPCPVGYRVPNRKEMLALRYKTSTSDNITYSHSQPNRYKDLYNTTKHYFSDGGYCDMGSYFMFIPFAGIRTSGYNTANGNGWTAVMGFVGNYSNNYSSSDCATASLWTYDESDTQEILRGLYGFQNWCKPDTHASDGDVYQRYFVMTGQFNNGEAEGSWQNGNFYDPNKVHAISCGSNVRCIKIQ